MERENRIEGILTHFERQYPYLRILSSTCASFYKSFQVVDYQIIMYYASSGFMFCVKSSCNLPQVTVQLESKCSVIYVKLPCKLI